MVECRRWLRRATRARRTTRCRLSMDRRPKCSERGKPAKNSCLPTPRGLEGRFATAICYFLSGAAALFHFTPKLTKLLRAPGARRARPKLTRRPLHATHWVGRGHEWAIHQNSLPRSLKPASAQVPSMPQRLFRSGVRAAQRRLRRLICRPRSSKTCSLPFTGNMATQPLFGAPSIVSV